jgi:hypothetical protein
METNKKVEETLASFDGIRRAEANPFIYERIVQRMQSSKESISAITPVMKWRLAAFAILLVGLNIFSLLHYKKNQKGVLPNQQPFATEYFSYINDGQL